MGPWYTVSVPDDPVFDFLYILGCVQFCLCTSDFQVTQVLWGAVFRNTAGILLATGTWEVYIMSFARVLSLSLCICDKGAGGDCQGKQIL